MLSALHCQQLLLLLLLHVIEVQIALLLLLLFLFLNLVPFEDIFLEDFLEVVFRFFFLEDQLLIDTIGQFVHILGQVILIFLAKLGGTLHTHLVPLKANLDPFNLLDFVKLLELCLSAPSG